MSVFWRRSFSTVFFAIALAGCETTDDGPLSDWHVAPLVHVDDGKTRVTSVGLLPPAREKVGAPPIVNYEGTGHFLGAGVNSHERDDPPPEDGFVLNVVNLPVTQAAKVVLGDILSVNYVVDPKVDGKVTVHTTAPVAKTALIDMFQSSLRAVNAAVVESGGVYKVIPLDQASSEGSRLKVGSGSPSSETIGSGLQVVQLKYVSASDMKRVLDPIAPKGGVLRADDARDALTLSGTAEEIALMLDTINVFDVDTMRGMSFGVVPVRASDPDAIADEMRNVFASNKDGPMAGMMASAKGNNVARNSQQTSISSSASPLASSDNPYGALANSAVPSTGTQPVNAAPVALSFSPSSTGSIQPANSGGATALFSTTPSADVENSNTSFLGDDSRIKISVDDANNALVVLAAPEDYKRIVRVVQSVDIVPNQVLIEATIAEVTLTDELQFGVQWYFQNTKNKSSVAFANTIASGAGAAFPGFSYALMAKNTQITLNALNAITSVNVISTPSLMVLDNKTATLQVGDEVPVTTQSAVSTLTAGAPIVNSVSYLNTGVILSITPRINESGRVLLDIEQEVSSVAQTTSSNIDSPTIQQRKIKTSVLVNNSEALTLGGLIQNQKTLTKSQLPLLGDIPLLGNAFKSKDDTINKTELLIIITPRVVRNLNEAQEVTEEYRQKLNIYVPRVASGPKTI